MQPSTPELKGVGVQAHYTSENIDGLLAHAATGEKVPEGRMDADLDDKSAEEIYEALQQMVGG